MIEIVIAARLTPVFTKGCIASILSSVAVRMQGAVEREEQELYRASFKFAARREMRPNGELPSDHHADL
jgi:hypothetical protein